MILGTGVDIVKIDRIKKILSKREKSFLEKVFTKEEKNYICKKNKRPETIAGIFAAKEAISKVLGTGISSVGWKDIEIGHNEAGKPFVKLYGEAINVLKNLGIIKIYLSITHEEEFAVAIALGQGDFKRVNIDNIKGQEVLKFLPKREKESHKGTYGRVGVVAGSKGMTGACFLSCMSALRCGSGLVYGIIPESLSDILSIKLTEVVLKPVKDDKKGYFIYDSMDEIRDSLNNLDAVAIGPGIGTDPETVKVVVELLKTVNKPVVLDADGINCIASNPGILKERKSPTIITPHPGEFARLLKVPTKEIQNGRIKYSKEISKRYNIIIVLKGSGTVVASKEGDVYVNSTGNPGMATAGSGDVLTGMVVSFLGQGVGPFPAAKLAVYLHGLAGDLARENFGEYGMIARDILEKLPESIKLAEDLVKLNG